MHPTVSLLVPQGCTHAGTDENMILNHEHARTHENITFHKQPAWLALLHRNWYYPYVTKKSFIHRNWYHTYTKKIFFEENNSTRLKIISVHGEKNKSDYSVVLMAPPPAALTAPDRELSEWCIPLDEAEVSSTTGVQVASKSTPAHFFFCPPMNHMYIHLYFFYV